MGIIKNYAIWNNKGGVGKSTITFHLASRYAELHPDEDVLVIDMCPQANVSMMLLGGGTIGEQNVLSLCSVQPTPQTVVGYITQVLSTTQGAAIPVPSNYCVNVNAYNGKMPPNLLLLCGDGNLEPIAPAIVAYANMQPLVAGTQPWVWVHNIIKEYINQFALEREQLERNISVFIDTNPAFGVYTELAIVAANKLICPVNADDSSRTAATAMMILLHGSNPPHPIYGSWTFAAKAIQYQIPLPQIHLIVGNRFTQYDGAATAFLAMSDATAQQLYDIYQQNPFYFTQSRNQINSVVDFRNEYAVSLRDFNTSGVVTAHEGNLLSQMNGGIHGVYGRNVNLDNRLIHECLQAVDEVIVKL
jgi:hypothetical protein